MKNKTTIREKILKFLVKRKSAHLHRVVDFNNIETSKKINILFNVDNDQYYRVLKDYFNSLVAKGIEIHALGYVKNKEDIGQRYLYKKDIDFFSGKDIKWNGKTNNTSITDFINQKPDLLINLSLKDNFHTKFVFALSHANFKVSGHKKCSHADFIIDISKNRDLTFFIDQIDIYLNNIKKGI